MNRLRGDLLRHFVDEPEAELLKKNRYLQCRQTSLVKIGPAKERACPVAIRAALAASGRHLATAQWTGNKTNFVTSLAQWNSVDITCNDTVVLATSTRGIHAACCR